MQASATPFGPGALNRVISVAGYSGVATAGTNGGAMVLTENWGAAIDITNKWAWASNAGGDVSVATQGRKRVANVSVAAMASSAARLYGAVPVWNPSAAARPSAVATASDIWQTLHMEYEMALVSPGNLTAATTFFGFGVASTSLRTTNNVCGLELLTSTTLGLFTDNAGTEATAAASANPTLTDFNTYHFIVGLNRFEVFINGVSVGSLTTQPPASILLPMPASLAGEAVAIARVGTFRCWFEPY